MKHMLEEEESGNSKKCDQQRDQYRQQQQQRQVEKRKINGDFRKISTTMSKRSEKMMTNVFGEWEKR